MVKTTQDQPQQNGPAGCAELSPAPVRCEILMPVSLGELTDRLAILQLQARRIRGSGLEPVQRELALLQAVFEPLAAWVPERLQRQLVSVNAELWQLEDGVRSCERRDAFVAMARGIHRLNDRRAAIKRAISLAGGSVLVEQQVVEGR